MSTSTLTAPPESPAAEPFDAGERDERFLRLKKEIHRRLIDHVDLSSVGTLDDYQLRRELRRGIEELCRRRADLMTTEERDRLVDEVIDEALGLGPIDPLLRDPTISDILINGPKTVYVERRGRLERTGVQFQDEEHLLEIVRRIANKVGRRLDESSPMVDARLDDGSRVNAVVQPLAVDGALVSIRRFPSRPFRATDLIAREFAAPEMIDFLAGCVAARLNVVVSGGTGSGKTTLLNVLSGYIGDEERIATIEDACELQLQQPHVARMETRPANVEGKGEVNARDLLKNSLRMRPDRIIIGECRGVEAFDMLQAMSSGHAGSLTTIHANNTRDAISRLEMLVGMGEHDLPMWFVQRHIASAIDIVVQCARLAGGQRRITQISEVAGLEGNVVNMHDLFVFDGHGVEGGHVVGDFKTTGIRPLNLERLRAAGVGFSGAMFEPRSLVTERVDEIEFDVSWRARS